jgi:hypothetical protein
MSITCYYHPDEEAEDFCDVCGKPLCYDCNVLKSKPTPDTLCKDCYKSTKGDRGKKARQRSILSPEEEVEESFEKYGFLTFFWLLLVVVIVFELGLILMPGSNFIDQTSVASTDGIVITEIQDKLMKLALPLQNFYLQNGFYPQYYDDLVPDYLKLVPPEIVDKTVEFTYIDDDKVTLKYKDSTNNDIGDGLMLDKIKMYKNNESKEPFFAFH